MIIEFCRGGMWVKWHTTLSIILEMQYQDDTGPTEMGCLQHAALHIDLFVTQPPSAVGGKAGQPDLCQRRAVWQSDLHAILLQYWQCPGKCMVSVQDCSISSWTPRHEREMHDSAGL